MDHYWRQLRDMKGAIDPSTLDGERLTSYGELCAGLLARAHAQSPAAYAVHGYLGGSDRFAVATSRWSVAYADVAESDDAELARAVAQGRMPGETGM